MSPKDRLTKSQHISTTAREVDFVTRFANNWDALRDILGVSRVIRKTPGTVLKSKYASVTLQSGAVGEGEEIPYSQASVATKDYAPINVEKYAKGVSIEAINEHGYDDAVGLTDDQFLFELQNNVTGRFYDFVNTGTLTSVKTTFQAALADAQGQVRNKWKAMHKGITQIVGFCNILDAYDYLGAASITVQNAFGMNYIENFLGYSKLFLCSDEEVDRGFILATPVENMILYYVSPDDSDFARAGLEYTTDGITNLIGFHVQGNYNTAVSESFALMGMTLMAEYLDGIAVCNYKGSMKTITFTSGAATDTTGATKLTVTAPETIPADWTFYAKAASGTAPSAPDYGASLPSGWTKITLTNKVADNVTGFTSGHKMTMVATNAAGQVVGASGSVDVVVKG